MPFHIDVEHTRLNSCLAADSAQFCRFHGHGGGKRQPL